MTFPLTYDIGVRGEDRIKRVMRGVEAEAKASASRVDRNLRSTRGTVADPQNRKIARGFDQIGRAARAADTRTIRERMRLERRAETERLRGIKRLEAEEIRAAKRVANARHRTVEKLGRGAARGAGTAMGTAGRLLGAGAAIAGGIGMASALEDEIRVRGAASRLANQAGKPGLKGQLAAESGNVKGFSRIEALGAIEEFVTKTGDLNVAREIVKSLGTVSNATGADIVDLGATAGQAFNVLRDQISDPKEQVRELNALIMTLAEQGAMGAVEIRDLATSFGKLGAATRAFEGDSPTLLRSMGAFAQLAVARGGAEGSADAATATARLAGDIVTNKKKFKDIGVDVKSKKDPTKLRDPMEIMADVLDKTGGDIEKVSGLFAIESRKIFQGLAPVFTDAERKKKGSGRAAMMAEFQRFAGAQATPESFAAREKSRLEDEDKKLVEIHKQFSTVVGTKLIPVLNEAIPKFAEMIPALATLTEGVAKAGAFLIENPWKGLGLLVAGSITKDLAAAGIGNLVGSTLSALMRGAPAVVPAIAGGLASAGTAAAGAAGGGAALAGGLTLAGAGVLATGGAVAAGYHGYQLSKDVERSGGLSGVWDLLMNGPAKSRSGADYDKFMQEKGVKMPSSPQATTAKTDTSGKKLEESATKAGEIIGNAVVAKLASVTPAAEARRSNPIITRGN